MNDELLQETILSVLAVLADKYPDLYRADGLNPVSNRMAGFLMQEILQHMAQNETRLING